MDASRGDPSGHGEVAEGPWAEWFGEMARQSVLRRHMKRLPLTPEVMALMGQDQGAEFATPADTALAGLAQAEEPGTATDEPAPVEIEERPAAPAVGQGASQAIDPKPSAADKGRRISRAQVTLLQHKLKQKGMDGDSGVAFVKEHTGKESFEELTVDEFRGLLAKAAG